MCLASGALGQREVIDFASDRWVKYDAEIVEHLGRQCLIGSAYLPDIAFVNGIIEYDLAVDGSRGYPGITFRTTSQQAYENFYVRPHASGLSDALQYTPVFGGVAGWQLYSGDGFTAAAEIPRNEWIHLKLEIKGKQARLFINDGQQPALVIHDLKHDVAPGPVGIRSTRNPAACFANFRVTKTDDLVFDPPPQPVPPRGLITEWELSQPLDALAVPREAYPEPEFWQQIVWQKVATEPNGLLDIARHVRRSLNGQADVVFARILLEAEQDEVRLFSFGFSDMANIFLNGQLLYSGNNAHRSRAENFAGIINLQDTLHLPLRKGRNELLFQVIETFGGWGLMGQDNSDHFQHQSLSKQWQLATDFHVPESALYDHKRRCLYVTNYFRGGNEFISKMAPDGTIQTLEWVAGLSRPTGMIIQGDKLWVVERSGLVEIDLEAGAITGRHAVPGPGFLNDVASDAAGNVYISDTEGSKIYRWSASDSTCDVWLEGGEVDRPNGLLVDGGLLVFGNSGDGCLKAADLANKQVRTIACFGSGSIMDGIRADGEGHYLVSDFNGRLFHVTRSGAKTELLNTTASGAYCADFEYIQPLDLIIVPGLYDNKLTGYTFAGL
jgi:sugar lactone lactonase YvrE